METRNSAELWSACARRDSFFFLASIWPVVILISSHFLGGCAAPGEPLERRPAVPATVTDLAARQLGNDVVLTFTMPKVNGDQRPLKQTPAIEIYRGIGPIGDQSSPSAALLVTIPAAIADQYRTDKGQIRYLDSLRASDFPIQGADRAVYMVRTRASAKKASADSNRAELRVYPAPEAINDLSASLSREGVDLKWTPPAKTLAGSTAAIAEYHIYRTEAATPAAGAPTSAESAKPRAPAAQIGAATAGEYEDTSFEFGRTYVYTVRSVTKTPDGALESADSNRVTLTPTDVFPPAAPQGLVVVFVPVEGDIAPHLELSWAINSETDLAGYNVYRSEQVDARGTLQNAEVLRTPAFRDMSAVPGRRYVYRVTAVDRSGNESPASAAVSGGVPADTQ